MADTTTNDPSMEEILASIRRILAAEDERETGRSLKPDPKDVTEVTSDATLRAPVIEATMSEAGRHSWIAPRRGEGVSAAARPPYSGGDDPNNAAMRGASWLESESDDAITRGGPARWDVKRRPFSSDQRPDADSDAATEAFEANSAPEEDLNAALLRVQSVQDDLDDDLTPDASGLDVDSGSARLGPVELDNAASQAPQDDHAFVAGLGAEDLDDSVRRAQIRAAAASSDGGFYAESDETDDDFIELTDRLNDDGTVTPLGGDSEDAAGLRGSLGAMVRSAMDRDQARRSAAGAFTPDPVASANTEKRVVAAFAGVTTGDAPRAYGGLPISDAPNSPTVEELTQQLLQPMLREWVDANLPTMVERIVREEIERMAARARRMRRAMEDDV